ncbi:MAG: hypothetical protein ABW034_22140 [Steroidobacteraceae bacterium]
MDSPPIYPQRPKMNRITAIYPHSYDVRARKIMIMENLLDRGTWPSSAAAIHEQYRKVRGEPWVRDNFRIYYNDHAWHGTVTGNFPGEPAPVSTTKLIDIARYATWSHGSRTARHRRRAVSSNTPRTATSL